MKKEISLKKFLLCLGVFLVILTFILYFVFSKTKPFCEFEQNPCKRAVCNECIEKENKKVCSDCNLYNEDKEKIWTGGCIFNK